MQQGKYSMEVCLEEKRAHYSWIDICLPTERASHEMPCCFGCFASEALVNDIFCWIFIRDLFCKYIIILEYSVVSGSRFLTPDMACFPLGL